MIPKKEWFDNLFSSAIQVTTFYKKTRSHIERSRAVNRKSICIAASWLRSMRENIKTTTLYLVAFLEYVASEEKIVNHYSWNDARIQVKYVQIEI